MVHFVGLSEYRQPSSLRGWALGLVDEAGSLVGWTIVFGSRDKRILMLGIRSNRSSIAWLKLVVIAQVPLDLAAALLKNGHFVPR
jgi:hypothetical protein